MDSGSFRIAEWFFKYFLWKHYLSGLRDTQSAVRISGIAFVCLQNAILCDKDSSALIRVPGMFRVAAINNYLAQVSGLPQNGRFLRFVW